MANAKKGTASATKKVEAVPVTEKETAKETVKVATKTDNTAVKTVEKKELKMDMLVPCMDMVKDGKLIYKSKRQMGYMIVWESFQDVQYIDLAELVAMKATDMMFFTENWIVIPDSFEDKDAVMDFLRIKQYYSSDVNLYNIVDLLKEDASTIVSRIAEMSEGKQNNVLSIIRSLVQDGSLDSVSKIRALEKHFGCSLL